MDDRGTTESRVVSRSRDGASHDGQSASALQAFVDRVVVPALVQRFIVTSGISRSHPRPLGTPDLPSDSDDPHQQGYDEVPAAEQNDRCD